MAAVSAPCSSGRGGGGVFPWADARYAAALFAERLECPPTIMPLHPAARAKKIESGVTIVPSVCPHDCTSTCALDVERLDAKRIGRVRGSMRNDYTAGVICEKVARYAERIHHPDRLMKPLRRVGPKGSRQFAEISWADALDIVAEQFIAKARQHGSETVWPYYYAGTMGLVQRDGINRLRHAMKYSRWFSTICVTLSDTGWIAGVGAKRGADVREVDEHSELVVIWGGNPVNTQVNVMTHAMRAKKRGAKLVVVDPYRTGTAEQADIHLAVRPGTDGALAVAVMHVLFKEGYADWEYLRRYTDAPDELAAHVATRTPEWAAEDHRPVGRRDRLLRPALRADQGRLHPLPSRLQPQPQRRRQHACRDLPAGGDRRVEVQGRRRALRPHRHVPDQEDADRRPRHGRSLAARARPVAPGADPDRRPGGAERRAAGDGAADPEHQPGDGLSRARAGAQGLRARGPVHLRARAVPDRDGGLRRHRAAGHDVPRARRFLYRERPHLLPGDQGGDRAAGRVPREPLRDLRARQASGRQASRLRHDAVGDHGRVAARVGHVGRRDQLEEGRPGLPSRLRDLALPRRLRLARQEVPLQARLGGLRARAARRCRACPTIST